MTENRRLIAALAALAVTMLLAPSAFAQATRTWVSGVGDDANPCSRTAPCKTFAGAISKTAAGGEISVLDPAGFGGVTITKAISIVGVGAEAGVLVSGTNGIIVNAGATDVVNIKGIVLEGLGTALNGIRFLAGGALHVEDSVINNTAGAGIDFEPSGASELFVRNTVVRNNNGASGGAILVKPTVTGSATATLDNVEMSNNRFGLRVEDRSKVSVKNSTASGSTTNGYLAFSTAAPGAELNLESCLASNNLNAGVRADGANSVMRLSNVMSTGNGFGLQSANSGQIISYVNNRLLGNGTNGTPTSTQVQQ